MKNRPKPLKGHVLFDILTKGIYTTFTRAIKEAVSNAYDADADTVEITFAPKKFIELKNPCDLTIQIRDDGKGMSLDDFWENFASIESEKEPTKKDSNTHRYPIGQFGIGSFALVPFSVGLTIYSKKYREKPIKCVINAINLLAKTPDDYVDHVAKNISAAEIDEEEWDTISGSGDSGTVIVINGVTSETYTELVDGTGSLKEKEEEKGLFPNAPFTTGLKEIAWQLSTLLPLEYADDLGGIYRSHQVSLASNNPSIRITLSEEELNRQIYSKAGSVVSTIDYKDPNTGVHARGVIIAVPSGSVQPRQANGVILRLNNVGIGTYRLFGLVGSAAIRHRITGELHILRGLHKSLNAARDNFSGPAYDNLKKHLHEQLAKLQTKAYGKWQSRQKRKTETQKKKTELQHRSLFHDEQRRVSAPPPSTSTTVTAKGRRGSISREPDRNGDHVAPTDIQKPANPNVVDGPNADGDRFRDPVIDVQHTKGKVRFDDSHELFKKFKGQKERETIELVLRALQLAKLPQEVYERIITNLLTLK